MAVTARIDNSVEPIKISEETRLRLENLSLKVQLAKQNVINIERSFQDSAKAAFEQAGLSLDEYALDLDRGMFVKKEAAKAAQGNPGL